MVIIKNERGFTLLELVLAILIFGMLAVSVVPQFGNLMASTSQTGGTGTAGAIQSAINTKYSENVMSNTLPFWPALLDSAANGAVCNASATCFDGVAQPVTNGLWTKVSATEYAYAYGTISQTYTYDPVGGLFRCTAGDC